MKRTLASLIFAASLLALVTPIANASTDQCPNTWTIDPSLKGGYKELLGEKARLQERMIMDEGPLIFSDYSGELGPMPKPRFPLLGLPDIYTYGNTKLEKKFSIQVEGCPGKTDFVLQGGSLKDFYGIPSEKPFIKTTAKDWVVNNDKFPFGRSSEIERFLACLNESTVPLAINLASSNPNQEFGYSYGGIITSLNSDGRGGICGIARGYGLNIFLLNLTPECSWIEQRGTNLLRRGILMQPGQTCEFAFAIQTGVQAPMEIYMSILSVYGLSKNPITILESFKLTRPPRTKETIYCRKGKVTKAVTAFVPACPKGFKKK